MKMYNIEFTTLNHRIIITLCITILIVGLFLPAQADSKTLTRDTSVAIKTVPSVSERAAISSVENRIESLRSQVTKIKEIVQHHRSSHSKISQLQTQQQKLIMKTGPQELKQMSDISKQSDRLVASSQNTSQSVQSKCQTLLTETQQLMTEMQRLQSAVKAASSDELEHLAAEAAGLKDLMGEVKDALDEEYSGNCYDEPDLDACIDCCKWKNKITAEPGTQLRSFQESFRSLCIEMCNIRDDRRKASSSFENSQDNMEEFFNMLSDMIKQQRGSTGSIRKLQ